MGINSGLNAGLNSSHGNTNNSSICGQECTIIVGCVSGMIGLISISIVLYCIRKHKKKIIKELLVLYDL